MTKNPVFVVSAIQSMGLAALAIAIAAVPPLSADEGQKGQVHIQKVCPATTFTGGPGSYCSITVSDLGAIPVAAKVYYAVPAPLPEGAAAFLDSPVLIYVATGDWAVGRCTVDFLTAQGLCTISDGIGKLAGFSARLNVHIDLTTGITYWDGSYGFGPLPGR
jgi:hypothetical protein